MSAALQADTARRTAAGTGYTSSASGSRVGMGTGAGRVRVLIFQSSAARRRRHADWGTIRFVAPMEIFVLMILLGSVVSPVRLRVH
jgi:hypothetical protein